MNRKQAVIASVVSYKMTKEKTALDRSVNAVYLEGRTTDKVRKKWFGLKSEAEEIMPNTEERRCPLFSELDQQIGAIIRKTAPFLVI